MKRKNGGNMARPYGGRRKRGGFVGALTGLAAPFALKLAGKAVKGLFGRKKRAEEEGEGRRRRRRGRGRKRLGMGRVTAGPLA